ncbi:MAG: HTTM domain-containing protein [Balneolaceae bacterium]|nr:HTTM domain-containing protein [Balneolaceae bacterium]
MNSNEKNRFSNWIFRSFSVTPEGLALYRIFTSLFLLAFLLPSTGIYSFLGSLPQDFYNPPPGPMAIFQDFPPEIVFYILHFFLVASLISLLIGFKTKFVSLSTGVIILVLKGLFYSVGKINHDLLIAVVPMVMAFSGWGKTYSVDAFLNSKKIVDNKVQSWPVVLLAFMIGFMMFTAGFPKILGGWLDVGTQATYGHYFKQFFLNGRQDLLAEYAIYVENKIAWELLDYGTVLFEAGFLLAILHPKTTRIFVCFAVIFHFSTMMLLNIAFLPNFLAYAAFLNWSAIHNKIKEKFPSQRYASIVLLVIFFVMVLGIVFVADYLSIPALSSDLRTSEFYILLIALPIALYYLSSQIYQSVQKLGAK